MLKLVTRFAALGIAATALLALLLISPAGGGGSALAGAGPCTPTEPVAVPDLDTVSVDCTLTDPGGIKDLNVFLDISHTFVGDLTVTLTHADTGTSATLINRPGAPPGTFGCSGDDILAILDDEASLAAEDQCGNLPALSGLLIPNSPLSAFDGESLAGTWTLTVTDSAAPDTGTINDWALFADNNYGVGKDPKLANLWLCNQGGETCVNKDSGVEEVNFNVNLNDRIVGFSKGEPQTLGSFEFEVRYDAKYVSVEVDPGPLFDREGVECQSIHIENAVQFGCVTKGKVEDAPVGPGTLAIVHVTPTADDYSFLIANQENGIATQLINQDCNLSDLQGHPVVLESGSDVCEDAAVTIRYLEGDVHADCVVDSLDQQQVAFRWGAHLGSLLYNSRMDLEPSAPKKGDGDIDAKDLQFVFGRHGSSCKAPHPAQDPVDPKAKPEEPAT
jgi:subtilisin-like proprotein convertase family protein